MATGYYLLLVLFTASTGQAQGQNTTALIYQNGGYESMAPNHPATISVRTATVTSPGYPGHYPANLSSVFLSIEVPPDETQGFVSLHFLSFDLQTCQFCTCDYLHIDSIHMSLCGDSLPPMFTNNIILIAREKIVNNLITLHFRSDERSEGAGFAIQYEIHTFRPPTTPATNPGHSTSTQCPLAVCPTCSPDEGHTTMTENNCAKCVCARTTTAAPVSSVCPVAICPSCTFGHKYLFDSYCPRCVCLETPRPTPPRCKSPLLHMLMRISQHAEWIELEVKELKQEVDFAANVLRSEEMLNHVTDTLTNPIGPHEQHHDVIQKWQKLKTHLRGSN